MSIEPKPTTIELTGADAKFGRVLVDATRVIAKRLGLTDGVRSVLSALNDGV